MSTTQHEVGQVPSDTHTQPPFGGSALVLSIIGIVLLAFIGSPAGLVVGIVLLFINKRRYRMVGIIGVALSATLMLVTIAYFAIIFGSVAHNFAAPVAATAPEATITAQQQPTTADVVPAPDAVPTNPVETGPIQPVASTPEGTIRAVEAYRNQAYQSADTAPLVYYWALGRNKYTEGFYRTDVERINSEKPLNLVGKVTVSVTKVEISAAEPTKIEAVVTSEESVSGVVKRTTALHRTYVLINGRWLVFYRLSGE